VQGFIEKSRQCRYPAYIKGTASLMGSPFCGHDNLFSYHFLLAVDVVSVLFDDLLPVADCFTVDFFAEYFPDLLFLEVFFDDFPAVFFADFLTAVLSLTAEVDCDTVSVVTVSLAAVFDVDVLPAAATVKPDVIREPVNNTVPNIAAILFILIFLISFSFKPGFIYNKAVP
jgi:hypothetical protein